MKNTLKVLFLFACLTLYLNIGHQYSKIILNAAHQQKAETLVAQILVGPQRKPINTGLDLHVFPEDLFSQILIDVFWPVLLAFSAISWLVYFLIVSGTWTAQFLWWFVARGGLIETVGMRGIVIITVILAGLFSAYKLLPALKNK